MWFLPQLKQQIEQTLGPDYPVTTQLPEGQPAWLAVPVFGAAKQAARPVAEVAAEVVDKLATIPETTVDVAGGFVNVTPLTIEPAIEESGRTRYGSLEIQAEQKVVIEFGGMNIAKPMSVGHLRSTLIGDALQRLYRATGAEVTSVNHLGDWGTQFGKLLVAFEQKFSDLKPRSTLSMQDMLALYVGFHEAAERDPDLNEAARAMFKRLEDGDAEVRAVWRALVDASLVEFDAIFTRLGVVMDEPRMGESDYESLLPEIIQLARERGLARASDGALIVDVPGEKTPLMLQKKDGATVYATRDLAQVKYRVDRYRPNKIIYCVGNEQALHFHQYHTVARLLGIAPESVELVHVKFGLVRLPEGKMSTRKGRVVFLQDVLDEAVARARRIVDRKNPDVSRTERERIAEVVGIGAIKYFDLSHDRHHDIVFDWDRMLRLSGDSGPYLQYAYTRAAQILAKAGTGTTSEVSSASVEGLLRSEGGVDSFTSDESLLIRELARFPLVVERAAAEDSPHHLAQYLNTLATRFNRFYETTPVLQAEGAAQAWRLGIVKGVANVLKHGLNLLGIGVLEHM